MYDLEKEFRKFYKDKVVLPSENQQSLRDKKDLNIKRLKDGLSLYNDENSTSYAVAETRVQGSMAMSTVVQNDEKDYDIDVAIVFDKSNISNLGPLQARRLVCNALEKKCGQFKVSPECKTNCVRIQYADGYHVDFAVYRRFKEDGENSYQYEHSGGSSWTARNPAAITKWFQDEVKEKGTELRQVVRLSKMFSKSRTGWVNMPGGLIQSVVCAEVFPDTEERLDEKFYDTMVAVRNRLQNSNEVYNPADPDLSLLTAQNHYDKITNWLTRLDTQIEKLDILFEDDCTRKQAIEAWGTFFNHSFWTELSSASVLYECASLTKSVFTDNEEFIEDYVPINDCYEVSVNCRVEANGIRKQGIDRFLELFPQFRNCIPHGLHLYFEAETNVPEPYSVWWKVRNVGPKAESKNQIRGQIEKQCGLTKKENSSFYGLHYVECYIIKSGECVAIKRVSVPIGEKSI
ncbi:MAG: nucleotidyltransferase [Erysipelotrichia bacterium]|nr:nucleotidyltransferase [Erysipelotrichia bacterium]